MEEERPLTIGEAGPGRSKPLVTVMSRRRAKRPSRAEELAGFEALEAEEGTFGMVFGSNFVFLWCASEVPLSDVFRAFSAELWHFSMHVLVELRKR